MTKNIKIILIIGGLGGFGFLLVGGLFALGVASIMLEEQHFVANGKRGKAKILRAIDKTEKTSRGVFPRAQLLFEVSVPNHPTFQIEETISVPVIHAPRLQPGLTIDVLVDPEQRKIRLLLEE